MPDEEEQFPEGEEGQEPEGDATPAEPAAPGEPEYYLEVNDRQRYKTRDDAVKGVREAGDRIAAYSKYGSPDELGQKLSRLEVAERALGQPNGAAGPRGQPAYLEGLDEAQQEQAKGWFKRQEAWLAEQGFVKKDQLPEFLEGHQSHTAKVSEAREVFKATAKERGFTLTDAGAAAMEKAAIALGNDDKSPDGRRLNELWYGAGGPKAFAKAAFELHYGEAPPPPKEPPPAVDYSLAKNGAKQLPKSPAAGSTGSVEGVDPEAEKELRKTHAGRKKLGRRILERMASG